jgi:alkylation response protein AidB-like acyl-CoA dehydrogenase
VTTHAAPHGSIRLTEDQVLLRDAVRELADEQIAPRAADIDRNAAWPEDVRQLLASHDILGIPFAEAHGGLGADLLTLCLAIEQISRVCATSGLIVAVQEASCVSCSIAARRMR